MQLVSRYSGWTWLAAIALVFTVSLSTAVWLNLVVLCGSVIAVAFGVRAKRSAMQLRVLLSLSLGILVVRLIFRILFSGATATDYLIWLPTLQLNFGLGSVRLLGPITSLAISQALFDGSRLAAIVAVVTAANLLTDVRKLLRRAPGALFEIAASVSMALSFVPQFSQSISRIRKSARLRGHRRGLGFAAIAVPVFEDAFDRSLQIATSMDVRGFGFRKTTSPARLLTARLLAVCALATIVWGLAALLFAGADFLPFGLLITGVLIGAFVIRLDSASRSHTRFDADKFLREFEAGANA
jgi:energy-coupling factor transport system permease protein